jgi:peptidoglycan/xylan/chitin deacetylase (PgdA/CDA1 family)
MKLRYFTLLLFCAAPAVFAAVGQARVPTEEAVTCPILIFHSVRPYMATDPAGVRRYITTPDTLESELSYLRSNGYVAVHFSELARRLILGTPLPEKPVIISFDDGWESQCTYALPLLKKYGFTATFFIYTRTPGVPHYMSWEQILDLDAQGMEIGCHSLSHPYLTRIRKEAELTREIVDSRQILEAHLRKPVTVFAYPFGQYNDRVVSRVRDAGYTCARGTFTGVVHSRDELFTLTGLIRTASRKSILEALQGETGDQPKTSAGAGGDY